MLSALILHVWEWGVSLSVVLSAGHSTVDREVMYPGYRSHQLRHPLGPASEWAMQNPKPCHHGPKCPLNGLPAQADVKVRAVLVRWQLLSTVWHQHPIGGNVGLISQEVHPSRQASCCHHSSMQGAEGQSCTVMCRPDTVATHVQEPARVQVNAVQQPT